MPEVLNLKPLGISHVSQLDPSMVYIGRPSKWGNPFVIGRDGDRNFVIRLYYDWILTQKELLESLEELRGKDLVCWCAPAACHGDILLKLLEETEV